MVLNNFYFLRHGESINNKAGLINGWTDCELTNNGKQSAIEAAQILTKHEIKQIITSDLIRAKSTAEIVANVIKFKGKINKNSNLRERNWGAYENRPIQVRPSLEIDPPHGESWEVFYNRVVSELNKVLNKEKTLIIGHAGIYRVIQKRFFNISNQEKLTNCKPLKININPIPQIIEL